MLKMLRSFLEGHVTFGPLTIFGFNAMHVCFQLSTSRGYLCFHPGWGTWPWSFYLSPNGTPWAATFARGPGIERQEVLLAPIRKALFGHGFDTDLLRSYEPYQTITRDAEDASRHHVRTWTGGLKRMRHITPPTVCT